MKKNKIVWLAVSCLMVVALLVTSCGEATTDDVNGDVNGVVDEEDIDEVTTEVEEVSDGKIMVTNTAGKLVEKPRYGGELILGAGDDIIGFDEAYNNPWDCPTLQLTNEELMTGDWTKGPSGTGQISGQASGALLMHLEAGVLAESWEMPDDETIIYNIRQGVYFHDKPPVNGREMVASDVVFSLTRLYETPGAYQNVNYPPGERPISITAPDDWTVVIKTPKGLAGKILYGHSDYFSIIPHEVVEEYGDMIRWEVSLGTGPFMLVDYVDDSSWTLVRNDDYWQKDPLHPGNTLPYLDSIKYLIVPDTSTRMAALRTGKLDRSGVGWEDLKSLTLNTPELLYTSYLPGVSWNIWLRVDTKPTDDIRVRRALAMAIDQPSIVEDYYEGQAELLTTPLVPMAEWADMNPTLEELPEETQKLYGYYPEEAKELLTEAGYPDGFKTEIMCTTGYADYLSLVKFYWEKIGVDLNIQVRDYPSLVGIAYRRAHKSMILMWFGNSNPNTFAELWPGNPQNQAMVDDENINRWKDELLDNFMDWDKLVEIQREQIPYILSQVWFIQIPTAYSYQMWWPWLKNYHGESSIGRHNGGQHYMYVWLDQDLKEEMGYRR